MKRVLFLLLMLGSAAAFAQKQAKPNINKALAAWKDGKLSEAKEIIDAATTYEKTMNDGKTWYYRGLIYSTIDTTSTDAKSLDPKALDVAVQSFKKAKELGKANSDYFITDASGLPQMQATQLELLANYYLDKGLRAFQDDADNVKSLELLDKSKRVFESGILTPYRNDTLAYYVEALVAQQSDSLDLAIESANKYLEKGGKSKDMYTILYQIYYSGPKEDKKKALEVVRNARKLYPGHPDYPKMEIGLLIDMGKISEAKAGLEKAVKEEPNNKTLHFYLGYANTQMAATEMKKLDSLSSNTKASDAAGTEKVNASKNLVTKYNDEARASFQNALKVDPAYWEAQFYLANTYLVDVDKTSKELQNVPNTAAFSKKRSELVQRRVKESETAIPYLEKAEKMQAPDKDSQIEVLQKLSLLYYYTADDKNSARIEKKLKDLGVTED
ncbi:MAG TPA: tetratricopeptide repeat protein [Chryseosolibacter sp.]